MSEAKDLKEKLFNKKTSGWNAVGKEERDEIFSYSNEYMKFLNKSKTEREIVSSSKNMADENGFRNIEEIDSIHAGDKVYYINRDKNIFLAVIGTEDIINGINIIGSHADSPRLDLKPNPIIEEGGFAYFKTHYYGGIKKYQWTSIPYSMHGVIVKTNGEKITVTIGENDDEPVFTITDLLIHLSNEQMEKKLKDGITGEQLNVLIGNIPYNDEENEFNVKLNILNILFNKYNITEKDFLSAEIELVPAFKARTLGLDESMVGAYGQDDKVCVYTSMRAIIELRDVRKTAVCIVTDKEEVGFNGNTGMESKTFDGFIINILEKMGINEINKIEKVYQNSKMLSADVDGAFDPSFPEVFEKNNIAKLGFGVGINKYTGSRGKSGASDASAEYMAEIRKIFEDNDIPYQVNELGKVDAGGGGTIALVLANKGMDVLDCGIPVLSMHSPYEVTSKFDIFVVYKAYKAFWNR